MHLVARTFTALVAVMLLGGYGLTSCAAQPLTWSRLDPTPPSASRPSPRRGAALVHDPWTSRLILFGGTDASSPLNDVWAYHLGNRTWELLLPAGPAGAALPEPRHTFVHALYVNASIATPTTSNPRRALIVATGQAAKEVLYDIWALDLDSVTWRRLPDAGDMPKAVYGSAGGIAPSLPGAPPVPRFWLSHGFAAKRYSDTRYYDLVAERWVLTHGSVNSYDPWRPHARCIVSTTVTTGEQLIMYGGCAQNGGTGGPCPGRDAWRYDGAPGGDGEWHQASTCPSPRTRGAMAPLASPVLPPPSSSSASSSVPPTVMAGTTVQQYGGRYVLLYGGYEKDKQTISVSEAPDDELSVLDLESGEWIMLRAAGDVPLFRAQPAAAYDLSGGRVWVFGGLLRSDRSLSNSLHVLQGDPAATPRYSGGGGGSCASSFLYPHLHGIFMGVAWGLLLQAGWFIARYFKQYDPTWFNIHRACQVSGLLLAVVGLGVVMAGGVKPTNLGFSHGAIGLTALGLGLLQPFNALFRPHKGGRWRTQWEWLHLTSGRVAVLLGAANVSLGTFLVQGPAAVWISWHVLLGVFVCVVVVMEVRHQRALRRSARGVPALTDVQAGGGGSGKGYGTAGATADGAEDRGGGKAASRLR